MRFPIASGAIEFLVEWKAFARQILSDGVSAPACGLALCEVEGGIDARRGKGRPWNG